jgi:acyl-CoA synthetase (AMP-forming)/AMP-acid ligase II
VFSCGAPVRADVIRRTLDHVCVPNQAEMHTPYGATEALPVSTIEAREVLDETAAKTAAGAGVCVGRKFDGVDWRVIRISDEANANVESEEALPLGRIGELIVRGPQVSPGYLLAPRRSSWHRMGDVGYFDDVGRFWYCGRKSHRVSWDGINYFSIPCEEIFNAHPRIKRSALVGLGHLGAAKPVLIVELLDDDPGRYSTRADADLLEGLRELKSAHSARDATPCLFGVDHVFVHPRFPVDVRHNSKINREELALWADNELRRLVPLPPRFK